MKKFKDFIYDYNDILLAIIIILIAGLVIFWKVTDIMAYPSFAKESQKQSQDVQITDKDLEPVDVDPIVAPGDDIEGQPQNQEQNPEQQPEQNQQPENNTQTQQPSGDVKFEIKSGEYFSTAADKLLQLGLIQDKAKFIDLVKSLGLESKLQVGTFTIPAGSSEEDIARILTKTKKN